MKPDKVIENGRCVRGIPSCNGCKDDCFAVGEVLVKKELLIKLQKLVNSEITQCVDNPMFGGKAPNILLELETELAAAVGK